MNSRIIITGGPGAGKTTLITALEKSGFHCQPESGRAVIKQQMDINGDMLPWRSPARFAEAMQAMDINAWYQAEQSDLPLFYDRALPDIAGYLTLVGEPIPNRLHRAINQFRYATDVIILPPWKAIYKQDNERTQSWEEAVRTYEAMREIYPRYGYRLHLLMPASIQERVNRLLGLINVILPSRK
ncbi:AAA family ATPase [Salmonella enterica]|uniref:AAA family ATPase n=2 Tax=Salmonella enterica TaxID=28901 RepID=A0A742Q3A9_SALER|nr:ATPase [Salmonella enterica subsp. enterica serovar Stourbridge]EBX3511255.1 ATPase [Salmonella enterica subsp. enterica serovar Durham]ECF3417723.1 ATPase [Salmonella enterica subsp. enterica serovar Linton]ECK8583291.1 ATPase [Salmonella enterica subsp. enterica serovar Agbeni]EDV4369277.1 AAA family ATPase [Salmonella enterica subsp. enterica]EMD7317775.1 AAA family ATPase [Salmonella enterica]HCM3952548.1 AAA family ATPase [Salmonella enterica subsp. enterica serovar Agama]